MKKETDLTTGISQPEKVNEFISKINHPLIDVIKYSRNLILRVNKSIGEGIFWNAPTFYFTGKMKPFEPKEYKRYIVGFNLYKQDLVRLIFLRGADVTVGKELLEGVYKDGRRIVSFKSIADVKKNEDELKKIIEALLKLMDK
jgi:hypothetical protein